MPAMDTLLFNDPEVKGLAFAILEECTDLQAFGRRMLELLANAAMSAKADEACNAPYGERDEGRVNSRNGYRERGLSTAAGDVTLKIPKLRRGSFFPEDLIERYCRWTGRSSRRWPRCTSWGYRRARWRPSRASSA